MSLYEIIAYLGWKYQKQLLETQKEGAVMIFGDAVYYHLNPYGM